MTASPPSFFAESRAETDACIRTLTSKGSLIRTIPTMSTEKLRTSKTEDRRYADICGATNSRGGRCKLPAGWGTPGSGGTRCRYHGGCSTGPDDASHLEGNDFAEGNPGGCPPEHNSNAVIHGGFSDWQTAYERFQENQDAHDRIEMLVSAYLETASEHAADLDSERRERLARELATRRVLKSRASKDVWGQLEDGSNSETRGFMLSESNGKPTVNRAHAAAHQQKKRIREIAQELRL